MLKKFSVSYNMEQNKKKKVEEMNRKSMLNTQKKTVLNEDVAAYMLSLEQIYKSFNIYKFTSIEEAINIMMKDPDLNKFLHRFIPDENKICELCGFKFEDHFEINYISVNVNEEEAVSLRVPEHLIENDINNHRNVIREKKIEFSQTILDDFDDPYICRICFNHKLNLDPKVTFTCNHQFCKKCVTNYLNTNINNGNVLTIRCLYGGCPRNFTKEEIKLNVDDEIWEKFKKFYTQKVKLNDPNSAFMNCVSPDCNEIVEYDVQEVRIFVQCDRNHQFCSKCKELGWHEDGRCEKYDKHLMNQIQNKKVNENYKQCPKCRVIIEKNEGCNQMKCINCDYEFCWICFKQYTSDHYAIYNFTGCPGMRYNSGPQKKTFLDNKCGKFLWLLLSCIIGFLAVILILVFFFFLGCPYEFVKCYLEKRFEEDDDDDSYAREDIEAARRREQESEEDKGWTCRKITICIFLGLLGLALQPIYLMFYILYAMMECYRRFGCWVFYAAY